MIGTYCNFEWQYHTKQLAFVITFAVFLFLGLILTFNFSSGDGGVHTNSPYLITFKFGLISWLVTFVIAAFCNRAVLRDLDSNMSELVLSTSITKKQLIISRFAGVLLSSILVMLAVPLGMMLDFILTSNAAASAASFKLFDYIWPFLVMIMPTVFFISSFLFFISVVTKSHIATYLAAVMLFGMYMFSSTFIGSPLLSGTGSVVASSGIQQLAALVDPYAVSAFLQQTEYWSIQEQNALLVGLSGNFLINRLLWTVSGGALLWLAFKKFNMQKAYVHEKSADKEVVVDSIQLKGIIPSVACKVNDLKSVLSLIKIESNLLIKSKVFWIAMTIWVAFVSAEMLTVIAKFPFSSPALPTTAALIKRFQPDHLPTFGLLMLIFFSGEVFSREKNIGINYILHALPIKSLGFLFAKVVALSVIPVAMITLAIMASMVLQLLNGFYEFDLGVYASLYYFGLIPLAINGAICGFFQIIGNNRYVGLSFSCLFFAVFSADLAIPLGMEHPLFHFEQFLPAPYTKFSGYETSFEAFSAYQLYWLACVTLLLVGASKIWARGNRTPYKNLTLVKLTDFKNISPIPVVATCIALISGSWIFYQTNIAATYQPPSRIVANKIAYERTFAAFQDVPQPAVTAVTAELELMPKGRAYRLAGQMELVNQTSADISRILVGGASFAESEFEIIDAEIVDDNIQHNTAIFELNTPLKPNERTTLNFLVNHQQSGFSNSRPVNTITQSHAFIFLDRYVLPTIGYQKKRTIVRSRLRKEHNLPAMPAMVKPEAAVAVDGSDLERQGNWVTLDLTVAAPDDFTVVAPGKLVGLEKSSKGTIHRFTARQPIRNILPVAAGRYIGTEQIHSGVKTTVYSSPNSLRNVDRIHEAAANAIAYFSEIFGPYPYEELKIVEAPAFAGITIRGFAAPGMLLFGEQSIFSLDIRNLQDDKIFIDHVSRVVAREIARQWWGHSLAPANTDKYEGGGLFLETVARYAELLSLEKHQGRDIMLGWLGVEHDRYLSGRSGLSSPEVPLYRVQDHQNYLSHYKGVMALHALKEALGEGAVNGALREILDKHSYPRRSPVSVDLIAVLKKYAPIQTHSLIDEWFKSVAINEISIKAAQATELENGKYELDLTVAAIKTIVDEVGNSDAGQFAQDINIVVYNANGEMIYEAEHNILQLGSQLTVKLDEKPVEVILDPYLTIIDLNRDNNRISME
ncbi:hypothetical protein KFE96_00305 [Kordiimonas sp. SCSIO 12603]|uniref:ABC transporter permease/M1 family aminopeptidase n=1 Tax=Kordiimonas sp. SCSIO 12603 TaxID=2829596 RepID=UPI0021077024|nr:hypothetical protein [Kordiimonas sp. SCSIO 12603]UTW58784.1 hypothetical protein KFE96_00305 [Kordiimonas sp. SCSIO 12603]